MFPPEIHIQMKQASFRNCSALFSSFMCIYVTRCCWSVNHRSLRGARTHTAASPRFILTWSTKNIPEILYFAYRFYFSRLSTFQSMSYLLSCALLWLTHPSVRDGSARAAGFAASLPLISSRGSTGESEVFSPDRAERRLQRRLWRHSLSAADAPVMKADRGLVLRWNMTQTESASERRRRSWLSGIRIHLSSAILDASLRQRIIIHFSDAFMDCLLRNSRRTSWFWAAASDGDYYASLVFMWSVISP